MCDVPHIKPSYCLGTRKTLRFLARDARNPGAALGKLRPTLTPGAEQHEQEVDDAYPRLESGPEPLQDPVRRASGAELNSTRLHKIQDTPT
ncbi:hypothetical protein LMG27177_07493 [Paraburkholderia fynbosensis]|uniref:Uncharacterized protein n=2 Tax=Paraburkholderia fynbosensis TaxID=1200993 RepID=A0A6J5H5G5_9BURK|nr:hypothetical protein LMG27177_07493 [Paraburkholderia fynbosensis]